MKTLTLLFSFFILTAANAQVPQIEWQICLGGTDWDDGYAITQTTDGGYAVVGHALSINGNALGNHGGLDMLVVKLNSAGQVEWQKCYGGSGEDDGRSIAQTPDGGLIVGGHAYSNDGDVSGNHSATSDSWIVKLDILGNIEWQKCYGGSYSEEYPTVIKVTSDSGYVFVTNTSSIDGDVNPPAAGQTDFWIVKLTSDGTIEWENPIGDQAAERPYDVEETEDGGFIIAGTKNPGLGNYWMVAKVDNNGALQWEKTYSPGSAQQARDVEVVPGIGYVVVGSTGNGSHDGWVLLIDSAGDEIWGRTLAGSWEDVAVSVLLNDDGNYTILGSTSSQNGDITCNSQATNKFWWLVLDAAGTTILEQFCFGGGDNPSMMIPTDDNGYICVGSTGSEPGNHGSLDFWVVKLGFNVGIEENETTDASIFPNPVSTTFHLRVPTSGFLLQLFDVDGRKIVERVFTNANEAEVNVSNLSPGIYPLLAVTKNGERYWQKVVVGR